MKLPKSFLLFVLAFICFVSCNAKPTLQTYFVDHQETPNFISMDVPISFLGADDIQMTETQRQAINSIDKLNMLGYSLKSGNIDVFNTEIDNVKALLKDKRYNELLRLGNKNDSRVKISYIGEGDAIDELVVFGQSNTYGFAIIRVLGDDMDVSKIMELGPIINKLDTKDMNVEGFMDFML